MTKEELMKEFNLGIYSIQRWIRLAGSNDPEDIRKCMAERKASAKQKMSQMAKKRSSTEEGRAHLLNIASHPHTDESKAKLSKSLKGRKKSDETKARMSEAFKGRKYSDSMKSKLSESQKQRFKKINEEIKSFNDMITSAEAAEILHCGKTTFELVFRGKATIYRGKNLYPKSFLQEFNDIMKEHRGRSHYENEIFDFINMPDAQLNNRTAIAPKELDIYIPSKNLAIEFDGLYWHSTANNKDRNAHLNKTIECSNKGIRLIHIFEDEWIHKQELVKSIINSALGRTDKVYARNCVFKQVEKKDAEAFFNANHLNGNVRFDKAFGLYFKDELVQCCSFGKSRFKKGEIELLRMANKLGISVIGGFSKIMKHQPYNCVISYVDRRMYNGNGYFTSGWKLLTYTNPSYYYTDRQLRFNRMNYIKSKCIKLWNEDPSLTEEEMCKRHGLYKIYDCGCIKVIWRK